MRKTIVIAVLIIIALGAIAVSFGGLATQLTGTQSQTTSNAGSSTGLSSSGIGATTTKTQTVSSTVSGATTSTSGKNAVFMDVSPQNRIVPLGGGMSFTLSLYDLDQVTGTLSITVSAPAGLTFNLTPSTVTTYSSGASVDLEVASSANMLPATYQATIHVKAPTKVFNSTFDFVVLPNVVEIVPLNGPAHINLTVKAGSTVTWFNLDPGNDDGGTGVHNVTFQSIGVSSGLIGTYDVWKHTFLQPGVYRYIDSQDDGITGEIIVTA